MAGSAIDVAGHAATGGMAGGAFRFDLGGVACTVLSDGQVVSGDPRVTHPDADAGEIEGLLREHGLPVDRLVFDENILLLHRADGIVMFDTGLGAPATVPTWGYGAGRLAEQMAQAGIDPGDIRHVVLSHGHAEHIGGLVRADGTPAFPNAQLYISRAEFEFWIDPARTGERWRFDHRRAMETLSARRERITFIEPGDTFLPGITAVGAPGHTIDHLAFAIEAGEQRLCYIADAARHVVINVERPTWEFIGDADRAQTVGSRLALLGDLADRRIPLLSYHFPWPGLGTLTRCDGGFRFSPGITAPPDAGNSGHG